MNGKIIKGVVILVVFCFCIPSCSNSGSKEKLGPRHLKLLTVEDIAEITGGKLTKLETSEEFRDDQRLGLIKFYKPGERYETLAYKIERVDDLQTDYEMKLQEAKDGNMNPENISGLGYEALICKLPATDGLAVLFWHEAEMVRVNLNTFDISKDTAELLARKIYENL